jgi:acylphosphatase
MNHGAGADSLGGAGGNAGGGALGGSASGGGGGGAHADAPARRRVRVVAGGLVQGVWFRASAQQEALAGGVDGWVRNRSDGRVEAVFEGPPAAVAAMVTWMHRGPERASVTDVQVVDEPARGERGFSVR